MVSQQRRRDEVDGRLAPARALDAQHARAVLDEIADRLELVLAEDRLRAGELVQELGRAGGEVGAGRHVHDSRRGWWSVAILDRRRDGGDARQPPALRGGLRAAARVPDLPLGAGRARDRGRPRGRGGRARRRLFRADGQHARACERSSRARRARRDRARPGLPARIRLLLAAFRVAIPASGLVPRDSREFAIVTWFVPWAVFLSTGMLAWHEPDDLGPPPGEPALGMSELVRDALLGSGVAAGSPPWPGRRCCPPRGRQPVLRVRTAAKLVAAYVVATAVVGLVLGLLFGNSPPGRIRRRPALSRRGQRAPGGLHDSVDDGDDGPEFVDRRRESVFRRS